MYNVASSVLSALKLLGFLVALFLIAGAGFYVGLLAHTVQDHEAITETVLDEAECMSFDVRVVDPRGLIKIGKQVLCGYHLEWSNIVGGNAEPKEFAPDPGQSGA